MGILVTPGPRLRHRVPPTNDRAQGNRSLGRAPYALQYRRGWNCTAGDGILARMGVNLRKTKAVELTSRLAGIAPRAEVVRWRNSRLLPLPPFLL